MIKRARKILAPELAKLRRLADPVDVAHAAAVDAQLVFNTRKAEYEALVAPYQRHGAFLVKKYRLRDDEEIDQYTGVIQKVAPKPQTPPVKRGR